MQGKELKALRAGQMAILKRQSYIMTGVMILAKGNKEAESIMKEMADKMTGALDELEQELKKCQE